MHHIKTMAPKMLNEFFKNFSKYYLFKVNKAGQSIFVTFMKNLKDKYIFMILTNFSYYTPLLFSENVNTHKSFLYPHTYSI